MKIQGRRSNSICPPDITFERYRVEEKFPSQPSGKGKDALFEPLKLDLYKQKANSLLFRTSDANIGKWIQQLLKRYVKELLQDLDFTWREQDRFECPL